jgi:hypothetical protein
MLWPYYYMFDDLKRVSRGGESWTGEIVSAASVARTRPGRLFFGRRWRQYHDLPLHVRRRIRHAQNWPPSRPPRLGLLQRPWNQSTTQVHQ